MTGAFTPSSIATRECLLFVQLNPRLPSSLSGGNAQRMPLLSARQTRLLLTTCCEGESGVIGGRCYGGRALYY
eukprot:scaffold267659_cov35-Tisochrysis_lutea.AAC.2